MVNLNYKISGFTCQACARLAQKRIEKIEGVSEVSVLESGETSITVDRNLDKNEINEVLKDTTYKII